MSMHANFQRDMLCGLRYTEQYTNTVHLIFAAKN